MNPSAQDKLRELRQRLAELEPYPWEPVEAWIASATPLIKAYYEGHCNDFLAVTATPSWSFFPRWVSGDGYFEPRRSNAAEANAADKSENQRVATTAKEKILAFVDGLLDLPPPPANQMGEVAQARIGGLSDDAGQVLDWLREQYVKAGYPEHHQWGFAPDPGKGRAFRELGAHGYIKRFTFRYWRLTERGLDLLLNPDPVSDADVQVHHHGDLIMGTFTTNITGSTVGAVAVGDHAVATDMVTVHQGALTQAQHLEHIKVAKKALVDDEERLDAAVHEALEKFLKGAREVKVEAREIVEVQAELEGILDRAWAEHQAKALPQGMKVMQALSQSPAMTMVTKKLGA